MASSTTAWPATEVAPDAPGTDRDVASAPASASANEAPVTVLVTVLVEVVRGDSRASCPWICWIRLATSATLIPRPPGVGATPARRARRAPCPRDGGGPP